MPSPSKAARAASAALLLSLCAPSLVGASPVRWDLVGDNTFDAIYATTPRLVTADGQTLSITGWSAPGTAAPFVQSYLGQYTNGLGVVSSPNLTQLAIDNDGAYELVAIRFASGPITLTRIEVTPYATPSFRLWAGADPGALGSTSIAGLDAMSGWVAQADYACAVGCTPRAGFDFSGLSPVDWLLIAAAPGDITGNAAFKIFAIEGATDSAQVPVPGTVVLLGAGLLSLGVAGTRRRTTR
jgi:hypothetical protein